jgi:TM2 domain-containing membrane protein YozV
MWFVSTNFSSLSNHFMHQGSAGNVIAALVSFFIPGLGQLIQGRVIAALLHFIITGLLWLIWLGWIGHIFSCIDAARWKAP